METWTNMLSVSVKSYREGVGKTRIQFVNTRSLEVFLPLPRVEHLRYAVARKEKHHLMS